VPTLKPLVERLNEHVLDGAPLEAAWARLAGLHETKIAILVEF
jgi:hypothetical protein